MFTTKKAHKQKFSEVDQKCNNAFVLNSNDFKEVWNFAKF